MLEMSQTESEHGCASLQCAFSAASQTLPKKALLLLHPLALHVHG